MCLAAHLICCHRSKNIRMVYCCCLPLSIPDKDFINHFACPVASYHAELWVYMTHDITTILLWSFSTIKLQARVLATIVGFTKHLAKTQFFLLSTFWEHAFLSYLPRGLQHFARMQKSFSNPIPVIYCWIGLCQNIPDIWAMSGRFFLEHCFCFQQLKHMESFFFRSISHWFLEYWKFQNDYPWQ